jgi:hypothetical protein
MAVIWSGGFPLPLVPNHTARQVATEARAVNSSLTVVGFGNFLPALPSPRALMWRREGAGPWTETWLQDRICPDEGWELNTATAINDHGWVIGTGKRTSDGGATRGYILRLRPDGGLPPAAGRTR